jgi:acyl carrier protein
MNPDDARSLILRILHRTAPEFELETLAEDEPLADQMDIDSMDFLNVIIEIHEQTGVDIPEVDYPRLETLDGAVDYLVVRG